MRTLGGDLLYTRVIIHGLPNTLAIRIPSRAGYKTSTPPVGNRDNEIQVFLPGSDGSGENDATSPKSMGNHYFYLPVYRSPLMPLFIVMGKLTDKAIGKMKDAKERDAHAEKIIQAAGGRLIAHYYTIGRYDVVAIIELPSAEVLAKVVLEIGKWGTVSTETMTALLPDQMYTMAMGM